MIKDVVSESKDRSIQKYQSTNLGRLHWVQDNGQLNDRIEGLATSDTHTRDL